MCGRFTLTSPPEEVASEFELADTPELRPRYNIGPGQRIATIRVEAVDGKGGVEAGPVRRVLEPRKWGLVPHWAKDPAIGNRLINARAETVAEKPSFRVAVRKRRCLVPADGFYEWAKGTKQPYHVGRRDRALFAIAGLYERWSPPGAEEGEAEEALESCTLVTTEANAALAPIHGRMPVILRREDFATWLDPEIGATDALLALLRPWPEDDTVCTPVSRRVNNVRNDDPGCLALDEGADPPAQMGLGFGSDPGPDF